jgi:hypothetical protein
LQERWQEQDQCQLRIERDGRQAWYQGQCHAADHEHHRYRYVQATGEQRQSDTSGQQAEQNFEDLHRVTIA